jgi:long-chain acyl-CoA synthetase
VITAAAPWLSHYDDEVPPTLEPYPSGTLVDAVAGHARVTPNAPAMHFKGATLTYGELERLSDACAAAFAALGIARGDRVGLLLPNCPQFFIAELGAWKLGAIVAPLNPIYTEHELDGPIREHGIETVVTLTRFYQRIKSLQPRTGLRHVIATNIKEFFPPLLRLLFTLAREKREGDRITLKPGDHDFAHLLLVNRSRRPSPAPPAAADPAVLLMSGGTTGTPKGVLGAHSAYTIAGTQIRAWNVGVTGSNDVIFLPLPLFHVYANVGVQSLTFLSGASVVLVPNPRDIGDLLATMRQTKPTFFNGVPTLYIALLNHPDVQSGKVDFASIRICFSGASALMADTKTRFEALTGARIIEGYSLTEAMMALCVNPVKGPNKLGSIGMPLPDVAVRIFDDDRGTRVLPPNEVGEVAITGRQLMIGYWNRPAETADVLRDHADSDGTVRRWLHTGDLGYMDDDGYVFLVDRKKDLIKTSGYQVWPREIEEVIAAHPSVAEVGVAGIADSTKGEAVKAWVVVRVGQTVSEADLRAFCREKLAPYKVPVRVEFRSELPKTMVGKVLRRALRDSG